MYQPFAHMKIQAMTIIVPISAHYYFLNILLVPSVDLTRVALTWGKEYEYYVGRANLQGSLSVAWMVRGDNFKVNDKQAKQTW